MSLHDEIAGANERHWEKMVKERCGYTIPWLDLDRVLLRQYATGQLETVPDSLIEMYPPSVLADVEGKEVLCLASGGGQQSAVFGLLGARVTVVELAEGQLDGDRKAAEHYGYEVATLKGDMRDLSCLHDMSFDLVYQGTSMGYVPDVRQVYSEVARVLRTGGVYRVDFQQPTVFSAEWNGEAYCITRPYAEKTYRRADGAIEFRHYLSDIFNGLLGVGFSIEQVHEEPHYQRQALQAQPGSWTHQQTYVSGGFAIVAKNLKF
ncbi:MAG: class I SAM-dependent methyltransferase [Chloroflexi bacterium]|nr:class I SAM-dependent methyltransferase [Chloroflexota bacterium]